MTRWPDCCLRDGSTASSTTATWKIAEHSGADPQDRDLPLLVAGSGCRTSQAGPQLLRAHIRSVRFTLR